MIYVPLGSVGAVESMCHPLQQLFDDISVPRGYLGCRIHASPVTAFHL